MNTALQSMTHEMTHIFILSVIAFVLAMFLTPLYTFFAYRYRFWKTQRTNAVTGDKLQVFNELHKAKIRRNIPTMAGIIAVVSITIDGEFVVHDIKVIEGEKGLFIAMPSKKALDGEYRDIAHPINSGTREKIQNTILDRYQESLEADTEESGEM